MLLLPPPPSSAAVSAARVATNDPVTADIPDANAVQRRDSKDQRRGDLVPQPG